MGVGEVIFRFAMLNIPLRGAHKSIERSSKSAYLTMDANLCFSLSSRNFQVKYLPDEKFSAGIKNIGHAFLYKHPGFLTVSSNFASCSLELVHTFFFAFCSLFVNSDTGSAGIEDES